MPKIVQHFPLYPVRIAKVPKINSSLPFPVLYKGHGPQACSTLVKLHLRNSSANARPPRPAKHPCPRPITRLDLHTSSPQSHYATVSADSQFVAPRPPNPIARIIPLARATIIRPGRFPVVPARRELLEYYLSTTTRRSERKQRAKCKKRGERESLVIYNELLRRCTTQFTPRFAAAAVHGEGKHSSETVRRRGQEKPRAICLRCAKERRVFGLEIGDETVTKRYPIALHVLGVEEVCLTPV
uniref:30S ribosomal protein S14, chloroplastic n=1 Tax=Steinernema glaseri TaxID=37863 RepID=A0A1I7YU54_9BILA